MQTTTAIAALLDPFAASQGGVQGVGLMSGPPADANDKSAGESEFGDALAAAMAAALGQPAPVQPASTPPSAKGEGADPAGAGRAQAVLAPMIAASDASTADASSVVPAAAPTSIESAVTGSSEFLETGANAAQDLVTAAPAQPPFTGSAPAAPGDRSAPVELALNPRPAPAEAEAQTALKDPLQTRPPVQPEAQIGGQTQTPAPVQGPTPAQVQPPVTAPSLPAAATPTPASSTPLPSTIADAAPAATAPTQLAPPQAQSQVATQAQPQGDSNSRSAKAKASAPAEGRNPPQTTLVDAGADADAKPEITAGADDNSQPFSPVVDDQAKQAEPQSERPALAAAPAASGLAEHRAAHPPVAEAPRATPQTVALLAGQISSKLDGKSTRFDVQLDPHGLGKVDVRVEISARGEVSAALTFENPHAASELRGRSGELQTALEQAGFDLTKTSLSFNSGGQSQQQSLFDQQQNQAPVWRGRAFTDLSDTPEAAPAPVQRRAAAGGVDVRI